VSSLLAGLRVVELSDGLGAAFAGRLFARLGAEVCLIERPRTGSEVRWKAPFLADVPGAERGGLFQFTAAGKKSVTLSLDAADGQAIFADLFRGADLLIEDRGRDLPWLADDATLRSWNPRATILALRPFVSGGPYADYQASELEIAALGGWMVQVGEPGRTPLTTASETTSAFVPGVTGAIAAMACILGGGGRRVDLAAADALLAATRCNETYFHSSGIQIQRSGKSFAGWSPTYRVFEAADGWVSCAASTDAQVELLMQLAGVSDDRFVTREGRYAEAEAFVAALGRWFRGKTREEIFHEAQTWRIPMGSVSTIDEVADLAQVRARGFFEEVDHPIGGRLRMPGGPARFPEGPVIEPRRAPLLGEHTEEILSQRAGIDPARLAALRGAGVA
jgi:crotonobetainyl-CoA:carnitine CoA-transferase CaiB-like acyl-CoA transferase